MKRLLLAIIILFSASGWSQLTVFTTASAIVRDPNNVIYAGGTYNISFVSATTGQNFVGLYAVVPAAQSGSLDSFGAMSVQVIDNNQISPTGSQWRFSICSASGLTCFATNITITGTSQDISAALKAAAAVLPSTGGGSGTVTSIATSSPLSGGTITTSGTLSCPTCEVTTNKNSASGYAGLDGSSKLNGAQQVYGTTANTAAQGNDSRITGAVQSTRNVNTTSPITGGGDLSADRTIAINDAAADGSAKGAASFTAADFNASSGLISLDYTNGQAADGTHKGFLTSGDWTTFNSKQAAIAGNTLAANNFAIAINAAGTISGAQPSASNLSDGTTGSGTIVLSVSPALTGSPTAPTQTFTDSSTKIASTAFVQNFAPGGAGAAINWFSPGFTSGSVSVGTINVVRLAHFSLPATVSFNTIGVTNTLADAGSLFSFGVYSLDGTTRYAHTTPQGMTGSNTFRALAIIEGTVTIPQGDYLFAWTGNSLTGTFQTMNTFPSRLAPASSSTTTASGVMPVAPVNVPALSPTQAAASIISFILYK